MERTNARNATRTIIDASGNVTHQGRSPAPSDYLINKGAGAATLPPEPSFTIPTTLTELLQNKILLYGGIALAVYFLFIKDGKK